MLFLPFCQVKKCIWQRCIFYTKKETLGACCSSGLNWIWKNNHKSKFIFLVNSIPIGFARRGANGGL